MKRIQLVKVLCIAIGLSFVFMSCGSLKKMIENHPIQEYTVVPEVLEMHGDKIKIQLTGKYAPKYFNSKAIVVIQPGVKYEGGIEYMKPIILRGEKTTGQGTVIANKAGGSFIYNGEIDYKEGMGQSELVFNPVAFIEKSAKDMVITNEVEAIEVPKFVRLGLTNVAEGTMITSTRMSTATAVTSTLPDGYEKETIIPHTAKIFFLVDLFNLNWNIPFNKKELNKKAIKVLDSLLLTGMDIKNVGINAWASPEGEESRNERLSENRMKTGIRYFNTAYNKSIKTIARKLKVKASSLKKEIAVDSKSMGEDWDGFIADLRTSDIAERNTIINVISSSPNAEAREQEIRNMTVIYEQIEDEILPSLRRAEINVNFLEPKKTDEEIAELSLVSPDSLKLPELLYAVTLTENRENQEQIYLSAIRIYTDDIKAYVNLSAMYLADGKFAEAKKLLETANGILPNNPCVLNNMGAVSLAMKDFSNAKANFETAVTFGSKEAKRNLGILDIKEGNYATAMNALAIPRCDYNRALAQLMNNDLAAAKITLSCIETKTAEDYYLLAVCAAREGNTANAIAALKKAVAEKPALKAQAQGDVEFIKLREDAEFKSIVG